MTPKFRNLEEAWIVLIALLSAFLLASHQLSQNSEFGLIGKYVYFTFRLLVQAGIFMAVLVGVERYLSELLPKWCTLVIACGLSLVLFTLTITAFDLIVGLPELGFNEESASQVSTVKAFLLELLYLLDNHVVLCLLLLLPRILLGSDWFRQNSNEAVADAGVEVQNTENPVSNAFLSTLEPALPGELLSVEAQEHYVQVVSSEDSRLVLYRFSDVVKQLPESLGLQVHRSHWVAHASVKEIVMQGQTMKLLLKDGRSIPVSRTFRTVVEERFG